MKRRFALLLCFVLLLVLCACGSGMRAKEEITWDFDEASGNLLLRGEGCMQDLDVSQPEGNGEGCGSKTAANASNLRTSFTGAECTASPACDRFRLRKGFTCIKASPVL